MGPRGSIAAEFTTVAALQRQLLCRPSIRTIAPMVSQIGKQVGQWAKRSGAAESTVRAVRIKAAAVWPLPSRTIATLVLQIGWRVGPWQRRLGVAAMKARVAHQQLAAVLRSRAEKAWQRFCCKVIPQV